jgi:hypothetical protein
MNPIYNGRRTSAGAKLVDLRARVGSFVYHHYGLFTAPQIEGVWSNMRRFIGEP